MGRYRPTIELLLHGPLQTCHRAAVTWLLQTCFIEPPSSRHESAVSSESPDDAARAFKLFSSSPSDVYKNGGSGWHGRSDGCGISEGQPFRHVRSDVSHCLRSEGKPPGGGHVGTGSGGRRVAGDLWIESAWCIGATAHGIVYNMWPRLDDVAGRLNQVEGTGDERVEHSEGARAFLEHRVHARLDGGEEWCDWRRAAGGVWRVAGGGWRATAGGSRVVSNGCSG